jgi:hypothetical protein
MIRLMLTNNRQMSRRSGFILALSSLSFVIHVSATLRSAHRFRLRLFERFGKARLHAFDASDRHVRIPADP